MIPCLEPGGGNCHNAVILVESLGAKVKLTGALEGTENLKTQCTRTIDYKITHVRVASHHR